MCYVKSFKPDFKFFNDNLVLDEANHQKHFNLIATSHLNLSQEDVDKIKFLFEKKEVKTFRRL